MEFVDAIGQEGGEQNKIEFILDGTPGKLVAMKMGSIGYGQRNPNVA